VQIDDDIVIYVAGHGFFATAGASSLAKRRIDWERRYGAALDRIELIEPPISIGVIQQRLPQLRWANYPRSITTVNRTLASAIRRLIDRRRARGPADLDMEIIAQSGLDELRALAFLNARNSAKAIRRMVNVRLRSRAVHLYVLRRADGVCEGCDTPAPFARENGEAYLEPHHIKRLADDGPDDPREVIALCPNCHRRVHHSRDGVQFNSALMKRMRKIEPRRR
jgi:hypothetical protein